MLDRGPCWSHPPCCPSALSHILHHFVACAAQSFAIYPSFFLIFITLFLCFWLRRLHGYSSPFRSLRCPELCDLPFFAFAFRVKHDPSGKVGPCVFCTGWRISHIDPPQGGFGKIKDLFFYPQHRFSWKCIANMHGIRLVCFVIAFGFLVEFAGRFCSELLVQDGALLSQAPLRRSMPPFVVQATEY